MYDIIWLQGHPAIAAIHYYQHLKDTHVLYCPDDNSTNGDNVMTIRALARDILSVYDSNNKSLAVHFMYPCGDKRLEQVILLINKIRAELRIGCYELATSKLQINLLLGWSMSIHHHQHIATIDQWMRRCLVPYNPAASQAPSSSCTIHPITDDANLFCITDTPFIKQALFVNITLSMCEQPSSMEHGMLLAADARMAIQGWADAMKSLSIPGTLILFVDEKLLYGQMIKNETSKSKQEQLLTRLRKVTWKQLQGMNVACPIYMYSRGYWSEHREELIDQIACMQHRHHLDLSRSLCLHSSRQEARTMEKHAYLSNVHNVYLNEVMSKNRSIWKDDFSIMIQVDKASNKDDTLSRKSPSLLDLPSDITPDSLVPLVEKMDNMDLTVTEYFTERMTHGVTASDASIYRDWKSCMETTISAAFSLENDTIMEDAIHNGKNTTVPLSPPPQESDHEDIQEQYDGDPLDLMESFSYAIKEDMIVNYINNQGAYKRGGSILDTIDQTEFSGNDNKITLFAKAKGTAAEPYNVHIILEKPTSKSIAISGGLCSCPVGKEGKCKHCVATLKMFMINGDEFEYASSRKPPLVKSASTTTHTDVLSKDKTTSKGKTVSKDTTTSEKQPNTTIPPPPPPVTNNIIKPSPSKPPRRRRSLPWSDQVDEQPKTKARRKTNTEDDKKPKKATTKARQKKTIEQDDDDISAIIAAAPKRTTTRKRKKKSTVDAMDDEFGIDTSSTMDMPTTATRRKTPSRKAKLDKLDVDMSTSDTSEHVVSGTEPKKSVVDVMDDEFGLGMPASAMDMTPEPTRSLSPQKSSAESPMRSNPVIMFKKTPVKHSEADDDSDVTEDGLDLAMDEDTSLPSQNLGSRGNNSSSMSLDIPITTTTTTNRQPSPKEKDTIMIHSSRSSSNDDDERDKVDDLFDEIGL